MVIVKIMGGLGNQLFQYAFAKSIEKTMGYEVKIDISYFDLIPEGDTVRKFALTRIICDEEVASKEEVEKVIHAPRNFFQKVARKMGMGHPNILGEDVISPFEMTKIKNNSYLIGYWQEEEYFKRIANDISQLYNFSQWKLDKKSAIIKDMIQKAALSVSVHVRAGDYLNQNNVEIFGNICTAKYYRKACEYVLANHPNALFFVFTNDMEWTRKHISLPSEKIVYVSEQLDAEEDWVELYLMSCCRINIIANSSYSWWAAWLNKNVDKEVICPERWTNNSSNADTICHEWQRISISDY